MIMLIITIERMRVAAMHNVYMRDYDSPVYKIALYNIQCICYRGIIEYHCIFAGFHWIPLEIL